MEAPEARTDAAHAAANRRASVVVCAFSNERLERVLSCVDSVLAQKPGPTEVLVVVDHNEELRGALAARVPPGVEVIQNVGELGLASARNTAVRASRGDTIVFIDDDARARDRWLATLLAAFEDSMVVGVGGHAVPAWEGTQPWWFPDEFLWVIGCSYRGLPRSGPVRNPLGCNMAFRAETFDHVGLFHPGMGRLGTRPVGCEETEFCLRATRSVPGARLVMVPGAEIEHHVPRARAQPRYLLRRCYHEGISKALVRWLGDAQSLETEKTYLRQTLPAHLRRCFRTVVTGPVRLYGLGQIAVTISGVVAAALGYVVETFALRMSVRRARRGAKVERSQDGTSATWRSSVRAVRGCNE